MVTQKLLNQVESTCRHLLSQQDGDIYSPTYGCFDRRYWGWKLVDYAEATYQRSVYPLAWLFQRWVDEFGKDEAAEVLKAAVKAGLMFSAKIQHADGSFDQAFPNEHSYGATAFLLHPLLSAYLIVRDGEIKAWGEEIEESLKRAAEFLCRAGETHGLISNHLAGATLSLLVSADLFGDPRYETKARELLSLIIDHQSSEGWFVEYEGADPGYQTLCIYYLAQIYRLRPLPALRDSLDKAVDFLAWFVHPDGTFGGTYGSRRTAVYYPGGLALLGREFPLAHSMNSFMLQAVDQLHTVTVNDVDIGNMVPMLSNLIAVLDADIPCGDLSKPLLPWQREQSCQAFSEAGLHIRGNLRYYTVIGVSNGGVMKVFDRERKRMLWSDGGYAGQLGDGSHISTQMTDLTRDRSISAEEIKIGAPFYLMLHSLPTPFRFVLLRLLNITLMRHVGIGNWVKSLLVRMLISGKKAVPLYLKRVIKFTREKVIVEDKLTAKMSLPLRWLESGRDFSAIHMASAQYFQNSSVDPRAQNSRPIDTEQLLKTGSLETKVTI